MVIQSIGSLIKNHAPAALRKNTYAIKLFDSIFTKKKAISSSKPMKRLYYMSINSDLADELLRSKPRLLVVCTRFGDGIEGGITRHLSDFEARDIVTVDLSSLCNSRVDVDAILADPMPLRTALFQLNKICTNQGTKLVLLENTPDARLSKILISISDNLGFYSIEGRGGFDVIGETPWNSVENRTLVSLPDGIEGRRGKSVDDEDFIRGLQFFCGLRSTRNCFVLVGGNGALRERKYWNELVIKLIEDCERKSANLIIVEDCIENALNTNTYDRIIKSDKVSLFPGEIKDDETRKSLISSKRTIHFGGWIYELNKSKSEDLLSLLLISQKRLDWLFENFEQIKSTNANVSAYLASILEVHQSPDFGLLVGQKLVSGRVQGRVALAQSEATTEVIEGVQKFLVQSFDAVGRVDGANKISTVPAVSASSAFLQWGTAESNRRRNLRRNAKISGAPLFFIEDGFVRSLSIGLTGSPGLSFLIDDLAPYYDARQWSRIELMLASNWEIAASDRAFATDVIGNIKRLKVSKYNHAPEYVPAWAGSTRKKYLLVDQRFGDQSVASGLATEYSFRQMVIDAVNDSGNPLVILKRHPDGTLGGKGSYFSRSFLGNLLDHECVIVEDNEINPYSLFDVVDRVCCVTSGMGFEALIAGKEVKTYGAPFYAGWGLTKDSLKLDWRARSRSIEEIFYWAYMARSVYYDPYKGSRTDIAGLCELVAQHRDIELAEKAS